MTMTMTERLKQLTFKAKEDYTFDDYMIIEMVGCLNILNNISKNLGESLSEEYTRIIINEFLEDFARKYDSGIDDYEQ